MFTNRNNTNNTNRREFNARAPRTPYNPKFQNAQPLKPKEEFNFNAHFNGKTLDISLDYDLTVPVEQVSTTLGGFIAKRILEEFARLYTK